LIFSPKLTFVANGNNPTGVGLTPGETICFRRLEFTTDRFGCLSLSPEREDPDAVFVGMVHSGPPSLHTAIEELSDEGDATSGEGGALNSLTLRVQRGNPDCPHLHRTTVGEHPNTSNHPDGPTVNHRTTARYRAPP
jgi:hypothetical protein